jgi:hypothetical protein
VDRQSPQDSRAQPWIPVFDQEQVILQFAIRTLQFAIDLGLAPHLLQIAKQ